MSNSLAGAAQLFFPGVPSGQARDGVIAFNTGTTPWTAYVCFGGVWQAFGGAGASPVGANPTAVAGPAAVNGSAATFMTSDSAPAVQKCSNLIFGLCQVDGTTITAAGGVISGAAAVTGANPTATAGPNAINGSAGTFMRSDAAPAIQLGSAAQKGVLQGDGATVNIAAGVLSIPAATTTQQGGVTIDNITIKVTGNKISSIGNVLSHPGFQAGRWYTVPLIDVPSTAAMVANTLYAVPFFVGPSTIFTQAGVNVTVTSNTNHLELGIYNNANGIPGTLFNDIGTITMTPAAGFLTKTGLSLTMQGWYWLVVASDSTPTTSTTGAVARLETWLGYSSANFAATAPNITGAWTFSAGNLPANFPAVTYTNTANNLLFIGP